MEHDTVQARGGAHVSLNAWKLQVGHGGQNPEPASPELPPEETAPPFAAPPLDMPPLDAPPFKTFPPLDAPPFDGPPPLSGTPPAPPCPLCSPPDPCGPPSGRDPGERCPFDVENESPLHAAMRSPTNMVVRPVAPSLGGTGFCTERSEIIESPYAAWSDFCALSATFHMMYII